MAVKQDTRQKLLFANDDVPTIEAGKVCTSCKDFKSSSEFYTVKRKNGASRRLAAICKQCDNAKRQSNIERARGPDWVDGNVKRRNELRAKSLETRAEKRRRKREEKQAIKNECGEWANLIRGALKAAIKGQEQYIKSGWNRKCETAVKSLRNRQFRDVRKLHDITEHVKTWKQRCRRAKMLLRAKLKRAAMDAWKKKCSTCALNHKRNRNVRLNHTVDFAQCGRQLMNVE